MDQGIERHRAWLAFESCIHQRLIYGWRQLVSQAIGSRPLRVIHDELQDGVRRQWQRDALPVPNAKPSGPVA